VLLIALIIAAVSRPAFAAWKEGDALPDLGTFKLAGKLPDNLKGKVILVDFWASWCAPCKASFPAMEDLYKHNSDGGFTIIAVSVDEKQEDMARFLEKVKASFAVVRDADQKLVAAADVETMPTSFLIDRSGKIRFVHTGFRGEETVKEYRKQIEQLLKEPSP
jgi:thiol-disulfide isomerase/thioredoxin